jgi:hypothetical protein
MRLDIHTNLDLFPDSDSARSKPVFASIDEMAQFFADNAITHSVVLYPRDGYHMLVELQYKAPNVTLFGLQVLAGQTWEAPTDINTINLDILDSSKTLCKGIKLASHRGWWFADKSKNVKKPTIDYILPDGLSKPPLDVLRQYGIESGLDYGVYSHTINKILKQLPENAVVSMHVQGDPIMNSGSTPMMVARYAHKFPKLKFILNHMGDFGPESQSGKNKKLIYTNKQGEMNLYPPFRYAHSLALISSAILYANNMHNIWLDTSCYLPQKADLIYSMKCNKWCIGSDYPFIKTTKAFEKEESKFKSQLLKNGMYPRSVNSMIQTSYENTLDWLTSSWEVLHQNHVSDLGLDDFTDVGDEVLTNE